MFLQHLPLYFRTGRPLTLVTCGIIMEDRELIVGRITHSAIGNDILQRDGKRFIEQISR